MIRRVLWLAYAAVLAVWTPKASAEPPEGTAHCTQLEEAALIDLCVLSADAMQGRLVGTPGNAKARGYLIERFGEIGLEPVGDAYAHSFTFQRRIDFRDPDDAREILEGVNLLGFLKGVEGGALMAITAHYDHLGLGEGGEIFNGADDNASGVAALLAIAEAFSQAPPRHDVVFIAFDAEEGGLNGARHFVDQPPEGLAGVDLVFNLDMVGYSPDGDIWAAGGHHTPALRPLIAAAAERALVSLKPGYDKPTGDPREDWTLLSDHGPFHLAGIPFLYLGVEDHAHYHRVSDEFEIIDPDFFLSVVVTAIDLARRLDADLPVLAQETSALRSQD